MFKIFDNLIADTILVAPPAISVKDMSILCFVDTCSGQTKGIGSRTNAKSVSMLGIVIPT